MSDENRSRKGGGVAVLFLIMIVLGVYILYTDEISSTVSGIQAGVDINNQIQGFTDLLPLSLANVRVDGEMVCDLQLSIPTTVNNRAFFGTTSGDVISHGGETIRQPPDNIRDFLNEPQWYYLGEPGSTNPFFEWKNCYVEGEGGIASLIPLFNGQLANEKLSLLSFGEPTRQFTSLDPIAASLGPFTESTSVSLAISGKNDQGLFLVDKYNKANFARVVSVSDGIAYPITSTLVFAIENVKLDDYDISVVAVKPINEKILTEPFVFQITR